MYEIICIVLQSVIADFYRQELTNALSNGTIADPVQRPLPPNNMSQRRGLVPNNFCPSITLCRYCNYVIGCGVQ